jgi:hypothetical protein
MMPHLQIPIEGVWRLVRWMSKNLARSRLFAVVAFGTGSLGLHAQGDATPLCGQSAKCIAFNILVTIELPYGCHFAPIVTTEARFLESMAAW